MSREQADQVALAVDRVGYSTADAKDSGYARDSGTYYRIPDYMKHGRDNYIPLDIPGQSHVPIGWGYWFAGIVSVCGLMFVICAYIWR